MEKVALILLLFFFSLVFSYADPPFSIVEANNTERAKELNNSFNSENFKSTTLSLFGEILDLRGTKYIAGFSPLIDNCTNGSAYIIVRKGATMEHLWANGICDESRKNDLTCDFDNDGCAEYEKRSEVKYEIEINFSLGNLTDKSVNNSGNILPMPQTLLPIIKNSSGNDSINANLSGRIIFTYIINDQAMNNGACISNEKTYTKTIEFFDSASVYACGDKKILFLEKPILNEQWYKNNEIIWLLFSQRNIYFIEIIKESAKSSFSLYFFNITKNGENVSEIESIKNQTLFFIGRNLANLGILSEYDNNFSYLYRINYSDGDFSLGKKQFKIKARDVFLEEIEREDEVYSRQLSLGPKTETGNPPSWETTRKSFIFPEQQKQKITLLFGSLSLLLLLFFVIFFRYGRRW